MKDSKLSFDKYQRGNLIGLSLTITISITFFYLAFNYESKRHVNPSSNNYPSSLAIKTIDKDYLEEKAKIEVKIKSLLLSFEQMKALRKVIKDGK